MTKTTKRSFLTSLVALLLCFAMLLGTTFAWFTDIAASSGNVIQTGNLDIELLKGTPDGNGGWTWAENNGEAIFDYDKWEPGYTSYAALGIENAGSLAAKVTAKLSLNGSPTILGDVIEVYAAVDFDAFDPSARPDFTDAQAWTKLGTMTDVLNGTASILPEQFLDPGASTRMVIALHMREDAGNEYQGIDLGANFDITVMATQATKEIDSFDDQYDAGAEWPEMSLGKSVSVTVGELDADNKTIASITMSGYGYNVTIPAGVKIADGAEELTLTVDTTERSSNINMTMGQLSRSIDVHIDGIDSENNVPMIIDLGAVLPTNYNTANIALYHVEDGVANQMNLVDAPSAHNDFSYNPETGEVSVALASFSEVTAVVADNDPWTGDIDTEWFFDDPDAESFTIDTEEELAGFAALVGGMVDGEFYTFNGKTVYLGADLDLGSYNDRIFTPIGYYYTDDENADGTTGDYYSTIYSFEGTFDGQYYTISNIYQNTWEIKGDYSNNYYKDGMGLFGYVYCGTVKNLNIDNFQSDGEYTPTGCVTAYACNSTFENITITNCNPRVYNTGNGGIVGIGGNSDDTTDYSLNFTNITIDNSNKISALWGSWDVGCGGVIGMYRGSSKVNMSGCDVAAEIDVYNDVCGNYQYYQYRYSGMLLGTVGRDGDPSDEAAKFDFTDCRVRYGDWAEYYYCELVANSQASYTHDYQMSRLTKITNLSEIKSGDTWFKAGNFILTATDGTKTCYHIVKDSDGNLTQHLHTDSGYEDSIDEDGDGNLDLKEDKQIVHITFKQLWTGYGWGATPNVDNVDIEEYLYTITYINKGEPLGKVYVTQALLDENGGAISIDHSSDTDVAKAAVDKMDFLENGEKPEFDYWMNAGSTKVDTITTTNTDIILYPSFKDIYTITFVDQNGNVLHYEFFTEGQTNKTAEYTPAVPAIEGGYSGAWSDYDLSKETGDITVYPIYNADDGIVKLTPVDIEPADGIVDYYTVTNVEENDNNVNIVIPSSFNGKPVIEVTSGAFAEFDNITTVKIPVSITTIGADAFANQENSGTLVSLKYEQITFLYEGTYEQWQAIEKDDNWDRYVGEGSRIYFLADGTYIEETARNGIWSASDREWSAPIEGTYTSSTT